ncbi:hypothetical protein ACJ2A9_21985 [Anaerobacillus sp. MEB173]|uniref:hypothetical protein n=1 Tax=Anaerobacillus sp. MEB173 TaxID=3383345 RepID=UPI003F8F3003
MINIGIITAKNTIDTLKPIFQLFQQECEYEFLPYEKLQNIKQIFLNNKPLFDGFIFGGPLPYFYVEDVIKQSRKPVVYLDITEKDFYQHLFKVSQKYKGLDFSRVYIDFLWGEDQAQELETVLEDEKPMYTLKNEIDFKNERLYEEFLEKHLNLWREGLIDLSITRTANIVEVMKKNNLNVYYISITKDTIKVKIEELITKVKYDLLKDNQMVVGYIESPTASNISENELTQISIHKALLEFSTQNKLQINIQKNNNIFEIITSFGDLQEITNHFHYCGMIGYLKENLSFDVHIGWGIGITLSQALQHAKLAYRKATSYTESCAFVIDEDERSMGPLGFEELNNDDHSFNTWEEIEELSKQMNVSATQLQKILATMTRLKTNELTSNDVAEVLGLSVRSANRLLNQLVEKNLAKVEQKKQSSAQGRPLKVYTISLLPFECN